MLQANIRRYLKHGTLPQLRVFEASARLGSLTRAAEELHMAQPTASVRIRKLSETIGLPLFEQVGRRIYLTEAGRKLYEGCREVFDAFVSLEQTLGEMRDLARGGLRLAVSSSAKHFVPRLLGAFIEQHPGMAVSLQIHNHDGLLDRLSGNEDDLYVFAELPRQGDFVVQTLLANPLAVFARDDHPLARRKRIAFAQLAAEPFLMREEGSGTRMLALELFRARGLAPSVRMELGTPEAIKEAILAGLGVSIMPRHTLGLEAEDGRLACLDVEGFPVENHWYFVYPQGKQLSAATRAFLDFSRVGAKAMMAATLAR